jgi:putative transposase
MEQFAEVWGAKYPTIVKQWRTQWPDLITLFDFPPPIHRAIYTTNAIESVNSVIRKLTRNRKQYASAASAIKLTYMAIHEASKRWTRPILHWKSALNHLAIVFEGRHLADRRRERRRAQTVQKLPGALRSSSITSRGRTWLSRR